MSWLISFYYYFFFLKAFTTPHPPTHDSRLSGGAKTSQRISSSSSVLPGLYILYIPPPPHPTPVPSATRLLFALLNPMTSYSRTSVADMMSVAQHESIHAMCSIRTKLDRMICRIMCPAGLVWTIATSPWRHVLLCNAPYSTYFSRLRCEFTNYFVSVQRKIFAPKRLQVFLKVGVRGRNGLQFVRSPSQAMETVVNIWFGKTRGYVP